MYPRPNINSPDNMLKPCTLPKCSDPNETWQPLVKKLYAKVHGDYDAIQGGNSGETVEDMIGGVSVMLTITAFEDTLA
jgi:hypothetical protein